MSENFFWLVFPLFIIGLIPIFLSLYWIKTCIIRDYDYDFTVQVIKKEEEPRRYWHRIYSVMATGIFIIIMTFLILIL
jgi:hypothetical protein